jgi:hypothetical protein
MKRSDIINYLIAVNNYKKYLEIGVGDGGNYNLINCEVKTNVDPCFDTYDNQVKENIDNIMTSDEFFNKNVEKFDIIFIDGFHEHHQVYKDIVNSLDALSEKGCIVCHDMLPPTEWHQRSHLEYQGGEWNGDCWKAVAQLRLEKDDVVIYTIDTDWGCSIIKKGSSSKYEGNLDEVLTYSYFEKNKMKLMNVISIEEFNQKIFEL